MSPSGLMRGIGKVTLLTEIIPYLLRSTGGRSSSPEMENLGRLARFRGLANLISGENDDEEDVDDGEGEQWTTDKPDEATSRNRRKVMVKRTHHDETAPEMEKLVLSDDDIED